MTSWLTFTMRYLLLVPSGSSSRASLDAIDGRVVWGIIEDDLEVLIEDVSRLMT